jgi:hypothetical protein
MGIKIIFRESKSDPARLAANVAEYEARFANPFVAGARREPLAQSWEYFALNRKII